MEAIFVANEIIYDAQPVTEGKKKPDFLFPSAVAYRDLTYPVSKLVTLAAKTTCKDRWRQILNEANRLKDESKFYAHCNREYHLCKWMRWRQKKLFLWYLNHTYHVIQEIDKIEFGQYLVL